MLCSSGILILLSGTNQVVRRFPATMCVQSAVTEYSDLSYWLAFQFHWLVNAIFSIKETPPMVVNVTFERVSKLDFACYNLWYIKGLS